MRLCINIDHVATLRQARGEFEPDPVTAAMICELAGADGIVCHLREDRRHVSDRDVKLLREMVKTKLDLEMSTNEEIVKIACEIGPDLATLVPEKRQELTTEGGLDVVSNFKKVKETIEELHKHEIEVSLFIDPVPDQIQSAKEVGTDLIEIHTGDFANAISEEEAIEELERIRQAAKLGKKLDLGVNAGHGLNYLNIIPFREIKEIEEVSIGHAIISRAVFVGLENAVREMVRLVKPS
ncbi:MAG: pyridoxine 5'-phosphate synthase [Bacteroidetes bacterium]|nr:pyridoxine 5'-phosphate synthase [Bacteroidota bacterium]MBU2585315.1 pyridoxine 5'-phosphate synthase [Bacteroidota bacterium]